MTAIGGFSLTSAVIMRMSPAKWPALASSGAGSQTQESTGGPQDENLFSPRQRHRKEMGADRRRRPDRRPPGGDHRQSVARQAQADLHPPYGLRRPYRRRQCREDRLQRQQEAGQDLL